MTDLISKKSFIDSNISMSAELSPSLTEGQKACLRLVVQHYTSKEIARTLGISPFTVDQRLDAARRKLNAASRKDAAKKFAALEQCHISQPFVYEAFALAPTEFTASQTSDSNEGGQRFAKLVSLITVPPIGGQRHGLSGKEILVRGLNAAFFSTLAMAFVVVVLSGTLRLVQ